jgi:hypothetical protein
MYRRASDPPRTMTVSIFNIIPLKQHLHERCIGLLVRGGATTEAAESLIAQLHSQSKHKVIFENIFEKRCVK